MSIHLDQNLSGKKQPDLNNASPPVFTILID